jgi:invasion protein IalB
MFNGTTRIAIAAALMTAVALPTFAQSRPDPIKQHKVWGAFSYDDANAGKLCYILAIPTDKQPPERDHGDVFFLVSQKPDGSTGFEPQFEVGYALAPNEKVTVTLDGKTFEMFSSGKNAWLTHVEQEPELVAAMRAGSSMRVQGKSVRGTDTSYTYSLSGVTAALNEVSNCKR